VREWFPHRANLYGPHRQAGNTHMGQNNRRRRRLQSLLPTPEELEKSPAWQRIRQMGEELRSMRERGLFPKISPEMAEKLRAMREALENTHAIREARERRHAEVDEELRECEEELRRAEEQETTDETLGPGPGRPPIEFPSLEPALDAMVEQWPKARHSKTDKRQIKFVSNYCREHGDEVGRIYDADETVVDKALEQAFRRRIKKWKNPPT